ncbi:hypothetical protein PRNP1_010888 [Phytophthora ramorum]
MLGERQGVEALIEQWRRYSAYFGDLCFQLDHITEVSKNLVQVSASLRVTVTNATFDNVFPHLLAEERGYRRDGEEDLKAATLGSKLLERRLLLPCKLYFEWDESSCQLVRLNMDVDFLAPISRVLDSLEDAAYVLGQARISVDGAIGNRNKYNDKMFTCLSSWSTRNVRSRAATTRSFLGQHTSLMGIRWR